MLGTSRPSLREALQSLRAQGYLEIRHGAGVFVADPATTRSLREALSTENMSLTELFDMREVLELPEVRARFESQGNAIRIETPEQFKKTVHNDRLKWAQVVKDAKISID